MTTAATTTRMVRNEPEMAKKVGERIRECREKADVTQEYLAKQMQISRSAIAQWESGTTTPSLTSLQDIARLMHTTPEYLAFDIRDGVRTVYRSPEREGMHTVSIVAWGDGPDDVTIKGELALDEDYARDVSLTGSSESLRAMDIATRGLVPDFDRGDRVIIDVSATKPAQPGIYVYWNGISVSMAEMRAILGEGGKPSAIITEAGSTSTVTLDQIKVLGRVVAHWGRV